MFSAPPYDMASASEIQTSWYRFTMDWKTEPQTLLTGESWGFFWDTYTQTNIPGRVYSIWTICQFIMKYSTQVKTNGRQAYTKVWRGGEWGFYALPSTPRSRSFHLFTNIEARIHLFLIHNRKTYKTMELILNSRIFQILGRISLFESMGFDKVYHLLYVTLG